ncbi:MAG: magnesium transporter [Deltaproteobacteria bacterium]|nr:magnesium transporter [Deltaproteobacteria bacterium]
MTTAEKLEKVLRTSFPEEIQSIFLQLDHSQKNVLFNLLFNHKVASRTIRDFTTELLEEFFNHMPWEIALELVKKLQPDDAADLFGKLSSEKVQRFLASLDPDQKSQISKLLAYDKNTAGGIMNSNVFTLSQAATVQQAIEAVRTQTQVPMIFYLYVIDEQKHLVGIVSLRHLILSQPSVLLKDIMNTNVSAILVNQSQAEVAQLMTRHNFLAAPVVDEEKKLLGVVTVDDVMGVIQEEATQNLYRMAGVEKDERVFTPIKKSIKNRTTWLSVVASMGGIAGSQTLTIMVRGLALGEVAIADAWKVIIKELQVGVANGVINGLVMAIVAYYWKGVPVLGLVLMLSMIGNLFIAALVGAVIPIGLKAIKVDPAVASAVVVTTFTDCFGFFSFLGLATLLVKYLT